MIIDFIDALQNLIFNGFAQPSFSASFRASFKSFSSTIFPLAALITYEVGFIFFDDGNEIYNLKSSTFKKRIIELFGSKTNEKLVPINEETEILHLNGFIFKPEFSKKSRGEQYFFVNNRFIKSPYLNHAVKAAFEGP